MKYFFLSIFILIQYNSNAQAIKTSDIESHIAFLASDNLKGRGTSTNEELLAAKYIANEFKKYGLLPSKDNSFLIPFNFKKNLNPHDTIISNIKERIGYNVVGFLDNNAPYTIVIGAHYDHLGLGHDHNSLEANSEGKIHNGADDNASGTAGVLALANYFTSNQLREKFNFLFMCYSGEELGLLGSKKWCEQPSYPLEKINYMINMDMIGRLNDSTKKLLVYGVGTSPIWVPLLDSLNSNFKLVKDSSGIGPSDQTSFYLKNIPVLHFFTGQHSDYHKPSDDIEKINFVGEVSVLNFIVRMISATENYTKLEFLKTRNQESGKISFKVTLGIMPDYTYEGKGIKVDGVSENKPAFKAGIMNGDVIVQLSETPINSMQDYMKSLALFKKGDKVKLKVLRDQKEVELEVCF